MRVLVSMFVVLGLASVASAQEMTQPLPSGTKAAISYAPGASA